MADRQTHTGRRLAMCLRKVERHSIERNQRITATGVVYDDPIILVNLLIQITPNKPLFVQQTRSKF